MRRLPIAIIGSCSITLEQRDFIWRFVERVPALLDYRLKIVSGGCRPKGSAISADHEAEEAAKHYAVPYEVYPADWDRLGVAAGPARNPEIIEAAVGVVAVWSGTSTGSAHSVALTKAAEKPLLQVRPQDLPITLRQINDFLAACQATQQSAVPLDE